LKQKNANLDKRIKIGISSCLLGNEVRYDGGHSRSDCIIDNMGDSFEYIAFCPEVAIGMSIPRQPINLVSIDGVIRVRGVSDSNQDVTDDLTNYAVSITDQLNMMCGYIFKSRSPSCGLVDVNVYDEHTSQIIDTSAGQFAKIIRQQQPYFPVEDEVRLADKELREDFIHRVMVYAQKK